MTINHRSHQLKGSHMPRIGILALTLPLVVLGGCTSGTSHRNAEQDIIALERSAADQWSQGNPFGYANNAADDVTWFDDIGAQSRIEGIAAFRKYLASLEGQIPPHTYEIVGPKVQVYDDIGILTFHWHGSTTDGKPLPNWKVTSVYQHNGDTWHMVHANWSLVKEAPSEQPE
jgi:ketosteroid isomerase-like protein